MSEFDIKPSMSDVQHLVPGPCSNVGRFLSYILLFATLVYIGPMLMYLFLVPSIVPTDIAMYVTACYTLLQELFLLSIDSSAALVRVPNLHFRT